jgi:hypothetical protein
MNKSKRRREAKAAAKAARVGPPQSRTHRESMALVDLTLAGKGNMGTTRADRRKR